MARISLSLLISFVVFTSVAFIFLKIFDDSENPPEESQTNSKDTKSFFSFHNIFPTSYLDIEEKIPLLGKIRRFFTNSFNPSDKNFIIFLLTFILTLGILYLIG